MGPFLHYFLLLLDIISHDNYISIRLATEKLPYSQLVVLISTVYILSPLSGALQNKEA